MQKLQGWVEQGNTTLSIAGATGTIARKVQGSFPGATVTAYITTPSSVPISSIARASNVVTVTVPTGSGFIAGESVTISGVTDASFNGTFTIVSAVASSLTYAQTAANASSSSGTAYSSQRLATIYSDNAATSKANPFVSASDGTWFFYAQNGHYDVKFSGSAVPSPFTLGDFYLNDITPNTYAGTDIGAKINAAIAALPSTGGVIEIPYGSYSFSTPILINKSNVFLRGQGAGTQLTWVGGGSAAITLSAVQNCSVSEMALIGTDVNGEIGINILGTSNVGNVMSRLLLTNLRTGIKGNGFDNGVRECYFALAGTTGQTGIYLSNNANAWSLIDNWIRNTNDDPLDNTVGIHISGATGTLISGGNIEFHPGGGINIDSVDAGTSLTTIIGVYFESESTAGLSINIATGVFSTSIIGCFFNVGSQASNYHINIASGAIATAITSNRFANHLTAAIHNQGAAGAFTSAIANMSTGTLLSSATGVGLKLQGEGSTSFILNSFGVGIDPAFPFQVEKSNAGDAVARIRNTSVTGNGLTVAPGVNDGTHYGLRVTAADGTTAAHSFFGNGNATLGIGGTITINNSMVVNGSLGIGTSPSYPLHVSEASTGDVVAKIVNTSPTGYGLSVTPGVNDNTHYSLNLTAADGSTAKHQFFGNGNATLAIGTTAVLTISSGRAVLTPGPFATVSASPTEGMIAAITDSSTAVWGATITNGGANHVLGYYDGTNWTVMGK